MIPFDSVEILRMEKPLPADNLIREGRVVLSFREDGSLLKTHIVKFVPTAADPIGREQAMDWRVIAPQAFHRWTGSKHRESYCPV